MAAKIRWRLRMNVLSMASFRINNKNNSRLGLFMALSSIRSSSSRSSNLLGPFIERCMVVTVMFRRIRMAAEGRLGNNDKLIKTKTMVPTIINLTSVTPILLEIYRPESPRAATMS